MATQWDKESLCRAIKEDPSFCLKCPTLAASIFARQLDLVKLVEFLKDLLTDPEPSQRAQGILVLSSVLKELPSEFLLEDEVRFIVSFFCDRLKDHHDVIPAALKGILSIIRMKNFTKDLPSRVLNSLMLNITCQSQRQEDRLIIYRILDALVVPHLDDLRDLGPDLIYHVISSVDGERDPRNLNYLFSMLPTILRALSLGHLTEDFFEVMACYFPVDFKPAAGDPNQVTRESLAHGLSDCLTAIPAFAEFCIPLLLEKLDSSLRLAKLDSLFLLKNGCGTFYAKDISVHLSPIWMSLSREAFSGTDYEIRVGAREAVTCLLRCLADSPSDSVGLSDPMRLLLSDIICATVPALNEVQTSMFMPASELLLAAAKSCSVACERILTKVLPLLMDNFNGKGEQTDKSIFLRTMSRFLNVCKSLNVTPQCIPDITILWNSVVQLFSHAVGHEVILVRKEALFGLTVLVSTLDLDERLSLYNLLCDVIDQEVSRDVREQCRLCLIEVAKLHALEVSKYILSERLKLTDIPRDNIIFDRRLEAQFSLAAVQPFTQEILPNFIDTIVHSHDEKQVYETLFHLRKLLQMSEGSNEFLFECLNGPCNVVNRLPSWWISCVINADEFAFTHNEVVLNMVCDVLTAVTRNLNPQEQSSLVQPVVTQFYPGSDSFRPCDPSSPMPHVLTVVLLEGVLGCLHREVVVPEIHQLCCSLIKLAISCEHTVAVTSSSRLCASLINKVADETLLEAILDDIKVLLEQAHDQRDGRDAVQAALLHGWIIKGLALRGYTHLEYWIDKLVDLLRDDSESIALAASDAFQTILEESPRFLNRESHCALKLLYRQRVFVGALKLVKASKAAPVGRRVAYLMALTNLLTAVPQSVLANYLGEVLPMLLESLSQESAALLEAALGTLHGFFVQSVYSDLLKDHIQTMLPRLLPLTKYDKSMAVRRSALGCLCEMCHLPSELLLPFKDEVIITLEGCLDDPKRMVRKDAVVARSQWIMLAAPGSKG